VEENSEEKELEQGNTRNALPGGRGNNGGFREKAKGLELADASLCAVVAIITRGGSGEIFCGPRSMPRYSFRGEGSDKDFSLQSQTRRGKLSRNTPEIQEMGNFIKQVC
jgi:hypothetical protein